MEEEKLRKEVTNDHYMVMIVVVEDNEGTRTRINSPKVTGPRPTDRPARRTERSVWKRVPNASILQESNQWESAIDSNP